MKLNLLMILAATVAICTSANTASAQSKQPLRANIPFYFVAENKSFSPGVYEVTELEPLVIELRNLDDHSVIVTRTMEGKPAKTNENKSLLVFDRYGESYFLTQITRAYRDEARNFYVSSAEMEMASAKAQKDRVIVSLARPQRAGK